MRLPFLTCGLLMMAACAESPPAPPSSATAEAAIEAKQAPTLVDWTLLAGFAWWPEDSDAPAPVPEVPPAVLALDGREIEMEAEIAPIVWGEDAIQGYVLTRAPNACCVCVLPPFTEWIEILDVDERAAERRAFGPTRLRGRLSVGPMRDQFGYVRSFYRLSEARFIDSPLNRG